jgi:hypothetical protein
MSTTTKRSWLMRLLCWSPGPLLLLCVLGGGLMAFSYTTEDRKAANALILPREDPRADSTTPDPEAGGTKQILWDVGTSMLALGGIGFIALLWGGVYLQVVEASRGLPGLRSVDAPTLEPEQAARMETMRQALSGLGFRHDRWFSLDDFAETHVGAWKHGSHVAFVLYFPAGGNFRLRFVRRFQGGAMLVSSTGLTDLAYPPPPGMYIQARKKATVEELWAWHLEGEEIFPQAAVPTDDTQIEPKELFVEASGRWGKHRRSDPTWLLAVEPVEECWRIYRLCGVSLREQVEQGWAKV